MCKYICTCPFIALILQDMVVFVPWWNVWGWYIVVVRQSTELQRDSLGIVKSNMHGKSYSLFLYHRAHWKPLPQRKWCHRKVYKNAAGTRFGKKENINLYCKTAFLHMWEAHFRDLSRSNNCFSLSGVIQLSMLLNIDLNPHTLLETSSTPEKTVV